MDSRVEVRKGWGNAEEEPLWAGRAARVKHVVFRLKAFWVTLVLLLFFQALSFEIARVAQDSARHVVNVKQEWAEQSRFIQKPPGKELVLFMGDSKIVAGILPEVFDRANGGRTHSYNVALPGLPLAPHYFWLKAYLKDHDPPDTIVLNLKKAGWNFFHFTNYAMQKASPDTVFQYVRITGKEEMLIDYLLPLRANWNMVKRYALGKLYQLAPVFMRQKIKEKYRQKQLGRETYQHDWEYFFEAQFIRPEQRWQEREKFLHENRGYYNFREAAAVGGSLPDDYVYVKKGDWGEGNGSLKDPFVKKFFRLTEAYGIRVILINEYILPSQVSEPGSFSVKEEWAELSRRYPNVNFAEESLDRKIYPNRLFSDPLHLKKEGAVLFTRHVSDIFQSLSPPQAPSPAVTPKKV